MPVPNSCPLKGTKGGWVPRQCSATGSATGKQAPSGAQGKMCLVSREQSACPCLDAPPARCLQAMCRQPTCLLPTRFPRKTGSFVPRDPSALEAGAGDCVGSSTSSLPRAQGKLRLVPREQCTGLCLSKPSPRCLKACRQYAIGSFPTWEKGSKPSSSTTTFTYESASG